MATVTMKAPAPGGLSNKARELMEAINTDAGKHNVWVRTQANAPAQRPWFSEPSGEGSGPPDRRPLLSNKGGYTGVEGERVDATRGDLTLPPNGTGHDHGNDAYEPVIWI